MNPSMQRYLDAASGLTEMTTAKAEQIAKQLVRSGEAAGDQVGEIVDELLERQRKNREAVSALVKSETTRAVRSMGLATTAEVERLQKQVADLKRELQRMDLEGDRAAGQAARTTSSGKKTAKKASGKKASGKKTAKKASGKKTAKKASAKKTAKKTAAKKTASAKKTAKKTAKTSTTSPAGGTT